MPQCLRRLLLILEKEHPTRGLTSPTPGLWDKNFSCRSKDNTQSSNISSDKDNASNQSCMPPAVHRPVSVVCVGISGGLVLLLSTTVYSGKACNSFGILSVQKCEVALQGRRLLARNNFCSAAAPCENLPATIMHVTAYFCNQRNNTEPKYGSKFQV